MTWLRYRWARASEALRGATTYNLAEPIVSKDAGRHFGRLWLGTGALLGGRGFKFLDEGDHLEQSVKTADHVVTAAERYLLLVGNSATAITFTLPALAGLPAGVPYRFKNEGLGALILDGNAAETIDGAATLILDTGDSATLVPNGASWRAVVTRAPDRADPETSVASAATCDIGSANTERVLVTGTTTITSLGTRPRRTRVVRFEGVLILTHNAVSLILPTGANIATAAGDVATFTSDASGNWRCESYTRANGQALAQAALAALPPGYIFGLSVVSFAGNTVTFKAGRARADADNADVTLSANISKNFSSNFAVGDGSGGRGVALPTSGTFHIFAITRDTDQLVDIYGDTSFAGANKPVGWTVRRRIMSLTTDASANLRPVSQLGNEFLYLNTILDVNGSLSTTDVLFALSVPADIKVHALFMFNIVTSSNYVAYLSSVDQANEGPDGTAGNMRMTAATISSVYSGGPHMLRTTTARQIRGRANIAIATFLLSTYGYIDTRGQV